MRTTQNVYMLLHEEVSEIEIEEEKKRLETRADNCQCHELTCAESRCHWPSSEQKQRGTSRISQQQFKTETTFLACLYATHPMAL